jgi:signal transduction histidine kinase
VAHALLITNFLTQRMIDREAHVTMDFVQNVLIADRSADYFVSPLDPQLAERFRSSIIHFTAMHDVLRTNAYMRDGTMLWSSDSRLIGLKFKNNEDLDEALKGELAVDAGRITDELRQKPEHIGLPRESEFFIETYIPVMNATHDRVLGVMEIYTAPVALTAAISAGHRQVWAVSLAGGLALYLTLFWIVRSADRTIRQQRDRLIEGETLAVVGELASSVAHNIRNPLASIRSSAELALEMKGENSDEQARDIIIAVDRMETWMRELLDFAHSEPGTRAPLDAAGLLNECFDDQAREFERRSLKTEVINEAPGASINADAALLGHALRSLIANAIDATPAGGRIEARITPAGAGRVAISIRDTGRGMTPAEMQHVFRPFYTTKPQGLGLGLSLARRAIERFGGTIRVDGAPGGGTIFTIELPTA